MGALRRLQPLPEERNVVQAGGTAPQPKEGAYPRWIVATGVILYCCVFWAVVWVAASAGIEWVRVAAAGAN